MLATYAATGAYVAIRYLRPLLWADPEFLARFRDEARHLVELENPHVVRLHEYVETPTSAALVVELVDGVSLRAILDERGKTSVEAALALLKGSLLGLAAAHDVGIAHRAYKPENVLVQADGGTKIADFGLALPGGPPPYALPEGVRLSDTAADLYAATCVFVECVTGSPPREGDVTGSVPSSVRGLVATGLGLWTRETGRHGAERGREVDARGFVAMVDEAARAAYGNDWEKRGRRHLAELATPLALRFPLANTTPPGGRTTAMAAARERAGRGRRAARAALGRIGRRSRRLRGARYAPKPRFAVIATLAALAVAAVVLNTDRGDDGRPDTFLATPPREPRGSAEGERTTPQDRPGRPSRGAVTPTSAGTRPTPTVSATGTAATTAPAAGQGVSGPKISSFDGGRGTLTLHAPAAATVTVTATFAEGPSPDRLVATAPQTFTLTGATRYSRVLTHAFNAPACGTRVYRRLTVTTVPGGTVTSTTQVRGVPCSAPSVSELRVLSWNGSSGSIRVRASGRGPVRLTVTYTRRDDDGPARTLDIETRELRGRTTYTVKVSREAARPACGHRAHLGILVSTSLTAANGPQVSEAVVEGPSCPAPAPSAEQTHTAQTPPVTAPDSQSETQPDAQPESMPDTAEPPADTSGDPETFAERAASR
ncbi:serine/threonine-protein kinase [Thermocatellispora tengchongensis]|uniref:Serine/threonine-protein kinase n=1 Tax=Thermocatellispora tengchongensis TaxID=1073253 RepID=A0A840P7S4_9ACTN|nr:serine/threonine-protein kinase [Thermocatellispora tengchongensis]